MLPPELDIRRRHVLQRLVISLGVVVGNEVSERDFWLAREVVVLELDHVLRRPMPALDLALSLRVIWAATSVNTVSARAAAIGSLRFLCKTEVGRKPHQHETLPARAAGKRSGRFVQLRLSLRIVNNSSADFAHRAG